MKNLFIPYNLAVVAKQKGFNKPCFAYYDKHINELHTNVYGNNLVEMTNTFINDKHHIDFLAPLYQQIIDWFRDEHNKYIEVIRMNSSTPFYFSARIKDDMRGTLFSGTTTDHYYNALTEALEEAFNLI